MTFNMLVIYIDMGHCGFKTKKWYQRKGEPIHYDERVNPLGGDSNYINTHVLNRAAKYIKQNKKN